MRETQVHAGVYQLVLELGDVNLLEALRAHSQSDTARMHVRTMVTGEGTIVLMRGGGATHTRTHTLTQKRQAKHKH